MQQQHSLWVHKTKISPLWCRIVKRNPASQKKKKNLPHHTMRDVLMWHGYWSLFATNEDWQNKTGVEEHSKHIWQSWKKDLPIFNIAQGLLKFQEQSLTEFFFKFILCNIKQETLQEEILMSSKVVQCYKLISDRSGQLSSLGQTGKGFCIWSVSFLYTDTNRQPEKERTNFTP